MQWTESVVLLTVIIIHVTNLFRPILSRHRRECAGLYVMGDIVHCTRASGQGKVVDIECWVIFTFINELVNSHPAFTYSYAHPANPELWNEGKVSSSVMVKDLFWRSALLRCWCVSRSSGPANNIPRRSCFWSRSRPALCCHFLWPINPLTFSSGLPEGP